MGSWGKIIGFLLGLVLARYLGLIGLLLGIWLGSNFDNALRQFTRKRKRTYAHNNGFDSTFIYHTFSLLGHIAKCDITVKQNSINALERFMQTYSFSKIQRKSAIAAFQKGKTSHFHLAHCLQQLKIYFLFHPEEQQIFLSAVKQLAEAVTPVSQKKMRLLNTIYAAFGARVFQGQRFYWQEWDQWQQQHEQQSPLRQPTVPLSWAYETLGATKGEDLSLITKRYRKLLSQHHPDRIRSQDEEAIKRANAKTHDIKKAYDLLKQHLSTQSA